MPDSNNDAIRHALEIARSRGYTDVEISAAGTSFQATLSPISFAPIRSDGGSALIDELTGPATADITATLVGYYQPAKTPLALGQQIGKGEMVAVITALGLANDVESNVTGEVTEVFVKPGDSVQYGQSLAQVRLSE
ncbi:MAG TPA: biotin/lipoyl-containing protein [Fimbriimonadaceae bacterium]|jgi:biotin carboxyl carrier protein